MVGKAWPVAGCLVSVCSLSKKMERALTWGQSPCVLVLVLSLTGWGNQALLMLPLGISLSSSKNISGL